MTTDKALYRLSNKIRSARTALEADVWIPDVISLLREAEEICSRLKGGDCEMKKGCDKPPSPMPKKGK